jgi:G:T/U-mismatch repair DNA glycosylase
MKMTSHPYLMDYPVNTTSKYLIIGTHPPMPTKAKLNFFYGNRGEFWRLLNFVYPNELLLNNGLPDLKLILKFLQKYEISLTDLVYTTDGSPFSTDKEMGIVHPLNPFLKDWLETSKIEKIFFTSSSGPNSAMMLFKKWYRENYGKPLQLMPEGICRIGERAIHLCVLYSPSPTARRGIATSPQFKRWLESHPNGTIDDFRIDWYRSILPPAK